MHFIAPEYSRRRNDAEQESGLQRFRSFSPIDFRGERDAHPEELSDQEALFPESIPFGPAEALIAASSYVAVKRARSREIDIAIAACAIAHKAVLWTLNAEDFKDIPNLKLLRNS